MQLFQKHIKSQFLMNFILVASSFCGFYVIVSVLILGTSNPNLLLHLQHSSSQDVSKTATATATTNTTLDHIVFGIASSNSSWTKRKDYVKLWWKANNTMKGCVFMDSLPNNNDDPSLPPLRVSQDTSRFRYTCSDGHRSAIRLARIVVETVALNHTGVKWYVFGDDDTVFIPENLVKTLSKYDQELWYYIGANSEIYEQNRLFGFGMAFGGAGFAISSSLAKVFVRVFDSCMERYHHLYGSDGRVYSCLAELGVGLTHEPGFHQVDLTGNIFGLLAAHPMTPLVSLHHIDYTDPIFPNMTRTQALQHLFKAVNVDSQRILQQTICYNKKFSWTVSVSWGYAVQIFTDHMLLPEAVNVQETFKQWKNGDVLAKTYMFNTKPFDSNPCERPTIFYLDRVSSGMNGIITSYYKRFVDDCRKEQGSLNKLEVIKAVSNKLDLNIKQAPRRQCCDILPSSAGDKLDIAVRECKDDELIYMH
ncbi:uncharacterized protein LOC131605238 [Vicia villosa]|uniref:uncharacterized protein LOC131605238 n=1 Tax=Vicia villosa TaxID=3911 RepID=UPI00273B01DD|nr:uncharacterized protein LOC131605238 [Vicia villosa]